MAFRMLKLSMPFPYLDLEIKFPSPPEGEAARDAFDEGEDEEDYEEE